MLAPNKAQYETLAVHGTDVMWVTSPNLPDLPTMDRDFGRGKRTVQLDIHKTQDRERLLKLFKRCDVLLQGYRPRSLASYGLFHQELLHVNHNLKSANIPAFGPDAPWSGRRGIDLLMQTCSGMSVSEAEHAAKGDIARLTPCQALNHAGNYLLATCEAAALYRQATEGGSWRVNVYLAGNM